MLRVIGLAVFTLEIAIFAVSLLLRTQRWWMIAAPIGTYAIIGFYYVYSRNWCFI